MVALFFTLPNILLVRRGFFFLQCPIKVPLNKALNHQLLRVAQWPINKDWLYWTAPSCQCMEWWECASITFHT